MVVYVYFDDEFSKGVVILVCYVDEGYCVLVVMLIGGECGEIFNLVMDLLDVYGCIVEIWCDEMIKVVEIFGVEYIWLGFVDFGLFKGDLLLLLFDDCFVWVLLEVFIEVLVWVVCEFWLYVMIIYDENGGYLYFDYICCYQVLVVVYEVVGDFCWFFDVGELWMVFKLYYVYGFLWEWMQMLQDEFVWYG